MAEYINRDAVVKRIEVTPLLQQYGIPKEVRDGVIDLVKIQPAADVAPVVRWIPVTERLPEYDVRVLVTDVRSENHYVGIWTREKDPDDGSDCWFDSAGWWSAFDEVTHWQPLPEPPEDPHA